MRIHSVWVQRCIATTLVGWSVTISAQRPSNLPTSSVRLERPENVGVSSERLGRLHVAMQRHVDRGDIAGAVTLVARHGRVIHFGAIGSRDMESDSAMTADTIFRIRSMTKPIVTAAAMMLYEEGHFLLSDPISKWMPEYTEVQVLAPDRQQPSGTHSTRPASGPITVRHILTHTSGLASDVSGVTSQEFQKIRPQSVAGDTLAAFAVRLSKLPLSFEPGTEWQYGFSTDLVGRLIEIVSGQTLEQFLTERVFRPLKMNDTHFYLPSSKLSRFASVYRRNSQLRLEFAEGATEASPYVRRGSYFSATGGLTSTAADYFKFQQMMLNGGEMDGARLLGRKTVELMTSNHTGSLFQSAPGMSFGLGYAIVDNVGASGLSGSQGAYTWPGSMTTTSFIDPVEQLVGVMMIQLQPRSASITHEFQTLVYQAVIDNRPSQYLTK